MRQWMIDWYTAWINWSFDHPWIFVVGFAGYFASLVLQYRAKRGHWGALAKPFRAWKEYRLNRARNARFDGRY